MPKKRKINTIVKSANDIPYPKYRVEWIDCVSDSAWADEKEFTKMKLATPVNEGWIFSKDKISIKMKIGIIGSGIVGLTLAYEIANNNSEYEITIFEKEDNSLKHGTGRNSGVIHS